MLYRCR